MAVIPVRQWRPDASDLANPGAIVVENAVPGVNSYKPHPSLISATNALTARPRGAIEAKNKAGNTFQYAGDETKLYRLSTSSWVDASKPGGYNTGEEENWEFVRWKQKVLATNFSDAPQQLTFSGTNFSDLTAALRFRHVAVVRDFVVAGYTFDATDDTVPDRVRWSAQGDETDWAVSPTTLSDFRDLNGGAIQRVVGGEYGVIVAETSTFRQTWAGAPTVFQIDEVAPGIGGVSPGAVAQLGEFVFIASEHGFFSLRGGSVLEPIGVGRVDQYFLNDLDENNAFRMSAVADPRSGRVYWAYPGTGNTAGRPNRLIIFDTGLNKWSLLRQEVELIWRSGGIATTLEQLDAVSSSIDNLEVSLDANRWKGGAPVFSGFMSDFTNGDFSGPPMQALIETSETELYRGRNTHLNAFKVLVDGGTTTVEVGTRNRQSGQVLWSDPLTERDSGRYTTRSNARYHRFRLSIADDWKDAIGIQVDQEDARPGERRG